MECSNWLQAFISTAFLLAGKAAQLCGHTCMCIHKALFPSSPCSTQLFYLQCTLMECGCGQNWRSMSNVDQCSNFVKLAFCLPSWLYKGTNNARTPPYYRHASVSANTKVLKWRIITTFNWQSCHEKFGPPQFCPPGLSISALNMKYSVPPEIFSPPWNIWSHVLSSSMETY